MLWLESFWEGQRVRGRDSSSSGKCWGTQGQGQRPSPLQETLRFLPLPPGDTHSGSNPRPEPEARVSVPSRSARAPGRWAGAPERRHTHIHAHMHTHALILTHLSEGKKWGVRSSLKPTTDTNLSLTLSLLNRLKLPFTTMFTVNVFLKPSP